MDKRQNRVTMSTTAEQRSATKKEAGDGFRAQRPMRGASGAFVGAEVVLKASAKRASVALRQSERNPLPNR